ncbi:MAG: hypothetical protein HUK19_07385 [Fibrobacter sp.]|nr:hypothetical protein [Fibrobacter sp.]
MKRLVLCLMCAAAFGFAQTDEAVEYQEESAQVEQPEAVDDAVGQTELSEAEEIAPTAVQQGAEAIDYYAVDSLKLYNDLAEKFERRGTKLRRPGNPLIIAGSIALGVGLVTAIAGAAENASSCDEYYDEDGCTDGLGLYVLGELLATAGGVSLTTGIVLKIVGGTQLNRAKMYRRKANDYERRNSAFLRVVPSVDPVNGRVGTTALLSF